MRDLALLPDDIAQRRRDRARSLAIAEIPFLRFVGFAFLSFALYLNNRLVLDAPGLRLWVITSVSLGVYAAVSWIALAVAWRSGRDLTRAFLALDLLAITAIIYVSGAEASLLFFVLLMRVADQTQTTFRRALGFAALGVASYSLMLLWIIAVDGRPVDTAGAAIKLILIGAGGLYIALTARTAERRREQILAAVRISRDLIRQLEEQSADLRNERERAEEASAAKSEFVASVSHEMRTPLHGVIGMLQLAVDEADSGRRARQIEMARRSAQSLLTNIDDILDFARIEARRVEIEPVYFSIREFMQDVMKPLGVTATAKRLVLAMGIAPAVPDSLWGDPVRLRQILTNLVGNAIKFTDEGTVSVRVEMQGGRVLIEVRDTGIGIPQDQQNKIFDAFARADTAAARQRSGTGLGLSIVKRLLEAMGGSIELSSTPGRGSSFSFVVTLPFDSISSAPRRRPWEGALAGRRIVLVDSNDTSREYLAEILRSRGMDVAIHGSRKDAPEDGFDCIVTDDESALPTAAVVITSPLAHVSDDRLRVTRPVAEQELIDAIGIALNFVRHRVQASPSRVSAPATRQRRILVAEDDAVSREFAIDLLRRRGHEVTVVEDGEKALTALAGDHFDLVLMDIRMPHLDGLQVSALHRDREGSSEERTPIVALTAHVRADEKERCLEAGMDEVLGKPIETHEIDRVLDTFTGADSIVEAVGGNLTLLARLSDVFGRQTPQLITAMREAIASRDSESLSRSAHRMKSAVGNFGGTPAPELASMLESVAIEHNFDRAAVLFRRLESAVGALQRRISAAASGT